MTGGARAVRSASSSASAARAKVKWTPPADEVEGVPAEPVAQGEDDAVGAVAIGVDVGGDVEAAPEQRDGLVGDGATSGAERAASTRRARPAG